MSSRFHSVSSKLKDIQKNLQKSVDRLRKIHHTLSLALDEGQKKTDFLPRRLIGLKEEEGARIESYLHEFSGVISSQLDSTYFVLTSHDDLEAMVRIRKTIRYVRNAFSQELPLGPTLERLSRVLTSSSKN